MLRDPVGGRISANERVEQAAAAHIPDEYPHHRDSKRVTVHDNIDRPQWCSGGLTKSQKRRVQRLHQTEALEEEERRKAPRRGLRSKVWRVKPKANAGQRSGSSARSVNVTSMLLQIQAVGSPNRS